MLIKIKDVTTHRLKTMKIVEKETYDEVITRLIEFYINNNKRK